MLFISYSSKHFTCSSSFNAQNDLVVCTANTPHFTDRESEVQGQ